MTYEILIESNELSAVAFGVRPQLLALFLTRSVAQVAHVSLNSLSNFGTTRYTRSDWRPPAKPSFSSSRTSKTSSSTTIATAPLSDAARESLMRKAREAGNAAVARLQAQQATTGLDNGNQPEEQQQPQRVVLQQHKRQRMASEENQIQEAKHSSSASSTSHAVNFTSAPPQEEQTTPMPKQLQVQSSQLRRQLPEKKPWAPWRKKSKASSGSSSGSGGSSDFETGGGGTAGLRARAGADFMDKINEGPWQPWVHYIPVKMELKEWVLEIIPLVGCCYRLFLGPSPFIRHLFIHLAEE